MSKVSLSNSGMSMAVNHIDNANIHITEEEKQELSRKSNIVTDIIISTNWTGDSIPYTQTIQVNGVLSNSVVEILLPSTATASQVSQFQSLNIQDGGQSNGSITLRAFGMKNTEDIPVTAIVRRDT